MRAQNPCSHAMQAFDYRCRNASLCCMRHLDSHLVKPSLLTWGHCNQAVKRVLSELSTHSYMQTDVASAAMSCAPYHWLSFPVWDNRQYARPGRQPRGDVDHGGNGWHHADGDLRDVELVRDICTSWKDDIGHHYIWLKGLLPHMEGVRCKGSAIGHCQDDFGVQGRQPCTAMHALNGSKAVLVVVLVC